MTNERPVYIVIEELLNAYKPIIGHLFFMTSFSFDTISCFYKGQLKLVKLVNKQKKSIRDNVSEDMKIYYYRIASLLKFNVLSTRIYRVL